ncbi:tailspike protein [Acinetobacter phage APK127v]|uniref:Tailspike protein n=1 Tax=Acinetobacter phage APK127v TaxID=2936913 RepID=A0A9E7LTA6_9CAUD|nr:tailspike protein [Acinetobacter phage APK127v]
MNILRSFTETVVITPTDTFPISFEYDEKYDAVHVFLNDVAVEDLGYTVSQVNAVTLKVEPAIAEGTVRIERETDIDKMKYIFDAGALFIDQNVDADFRQIVHSQQEVRDGFIKLRGDVLPLVHGLQEALQQAQEASEAAQEAATAAEEAAQTTRSASQVFDASGASQQLVNDGLTYREIHLSKLGAKFDGTDETSILAQAVALADNNTTIVFDGPSFLFSSVDFGSKAVSLRGVPSISAQTLASTVKISGAGIVCNTQKVKLAYIDFQSTGTKTDGLNICLLTNNKNNGVWLHVTNCRASGFSGHVLHSKDLIDSKISGFVPDNNNIVFRFVRDVWANNTTIQLEKVYAQQNTLLFDADYCTQSSMIDCIFEYNTSMGHINNGVWTIFNLYTENNYAPLIATNTRLLKQYHFAYTNNDIIVVTQPELAYIDKGTSEYTPRKADIFELEKSYERYKSIAPSFNGQTWTKLGTAALGEAGSLVLEVIGNNGYSQDTPSASSALGKTTIFAQVKNNNNASYANIQATWHHEGSASGIAEVRFVQTGTNRYIYDVYVLQNSLAYIGVGVSVNKADAFVWDIQRSVPKPPGGGSGDVNTPTMLIAYPYYKVGAGTGYVGSDGTNPILGGASATTVGATGAAAALPANPVGYISVNINGTVYKMPYYNV